MKKFIKTILRGVGQVMLQNNAITGLLFLVGIFYNSWILGAGAILGNLSSTISARLFKYDQKEIEDGIYGFNGTLVGIATCLFFGFNIISIIALVLGSILSAIFTHEIKKWLPVLTGSFILSTWVIILAIKFFKILPFISSPLQQTSHLKFISAVSMGFGQVMLQNAIITGIIFFIAIFVSSRKDAIYALYGSVLGAIVAIFLSFPISMVNIGLFGFNAVLCGIALGGKKQIAFLFATFAIILSVLITFGMDKFGIIFLTAPFVLATWVTLAIKKEAKKIFLS